MCWPGAVGNCDYDIELMCDAGTLVQCRHCTYESVCKCVMLEECCARTSKTACDSDSHA